MPFVLLCCSHGKFHACAYSAMRDDLSSQPRYRKYLVSTQPRYRNNLFPRSFALRLAGSQPVSAHAQSRTSASECMNTEDRDLGPSSCDPTWWKMHRWVFNPSGSLSDSHSHTCESWRRKIRCFDLRKANHGIQLLSFISYLPEAIDFHIQIVCCWSNYINSCSRRIFFRMFLGDIYARRKVYFR